MRLRRWRLKGPRTREKPKKRKQLAVRENPAEVSVISVRPAMVKGTALEALENGIKLLVILSERVSRIDVFSGPDPPVR